MDIFDEEIIKFWKALADNKVRYILVGGFAANLHGYQRFTADMDIWIENTIVNRKNLRSAFDQTGMGDFPMLETMQFVPGWTEFKLNNGLQLDIFVDMQALEKYSFDECLNASSIADIDGVKIPFLNLNQLIANKKAVNRSKDTIDVIELEKIKQLRKEMGLD
jgi:predicted nucleotidyltransferase